jgi:hypothetical protein
MWYSKLSRLLLTSALVLLGLWCSSASAARRGQAPEAVVRPDVVTPHTPWATPLAGGPLRVLVLTPAAALRDAVELGQRLQVELGAEALPDPEHPDEAALTRLRRALARRWDVILLGRCDPDVLPEDVQARIVAQAEAGTGVVFAYLAVPETAPNTWGPLARWLGDRAYAANTDPIVAGVVPGPGWSGPLETVQASENESSRVVWLDYSGDMPVSQALIPTPAAPLEAFPGSWENAWSLVLRAVRWAAWREPRVHIADIVSSTPQRPSAEEIPPDLPAEFIEAATRDSYAGQPVRPLRIVLSEAADKNYRVRLRLRRTGAPLLADTYISPKDKIAKGSAGYPAELLAGPGTYWVDAWLMDGERVVDWFTKELDLEGWPTFSGLTASKTYLLPHDTLDLTLTVPPVFSRERVCTVYARATDALGRVVAQRAQALSAEGGDCTLRLEFADVISTLIRVDVFAVEGPPRAFSEMELLAAYREYRHFAVRMPYPANRFSLVVPAAAPGEYNTGVHLAAQYAAGADAAVAPGGDAAVVHVPQAGLRLISQLGGSSLDGWLSPCGLEPVRLQYAAQALHDATLPVWAGGSSLYVLQAADPVGDGADRCAADFAAFLESRHTALATLQAAWEHPYDTWEAAATAALIAPESLSATAAADRAAFLGPRQAHQAAALRDRVRSADRDALVGVDRDAAGLDLPERMDGLDFVTLPASRLAEAVAAPGYRAVVLDAAADHSPAGLRHIGWSTLFRQIPALWLTAPDTPITLPDARIARSIQPLLDWKQDVDRGVGALILAAQLTAPEADSAESPAPASAGLFRYTFGQAELAAMAPGVATVATPRFTHPFVYDVLRGKRVKRPSGLSASLKPGEAAVFAALPYRVEGVTLTVPASVVGGYRLNFVAQVLAGEETPGTHLFAVDLIARNGTPRLHYRQYLVAEGGAARGFIPLARNEIAGKYWVEVRDVLSGKRVRSPIKLMPNLETP